ncbi:hypothetical protein VIAG107301_15375 [Vibrio agarivorans]
MQLFHRNRETKQERLQRLIEQSDPSATQPLGLRDFVLALMIALTVILIIY